MYDKGKFAESGLPCPCGKSSDAYAVDHDGVGFCFRGDCQKIFPKKEVDLEQEGKFEHYPNNGISLNTLKFYNVLTKFIDGKPAATGYTYPNGATKLRRLDAANKKNRFVSVGPMTGATLFGKDKFDPGSKESITITEGEKDALSIYQVTGGSTAAVSVRSSSSAMSDCSKEYDYINSFDKIIICFDNDDVGKSAAKQIASLFDFKKVYNVKLIRHKDANEYLEANEGKELFNAWRGASKYSPDNIISQFQDIEKSLEESKEDMITDYPFAQLNEQLWGLFKGEVIVIKGDEGIGKQLANTTHIPTPTGWTTMGEIKVGDEIIGADGKPTKVTFVTEDQFVDCYKVSFNDGTSVIAGGPHKWGVLNQRNIYSVKTTSEILKEGVICKNNASRYSVPIMKPFIGPDPNTVNYPIAPYYLGYWLGDGHSYSADFSIGFEDWKNLPEGMYDECTFERVDKTCMTARFTQITHKLLADNNLIANKHIPSIYLRAPEMHRRLLLRGLMDSDGGVHLGSCEFYTSSERLKDDFLELARSLGYACRVRTKQSKLYGVNKKMSYTVRFKAENGWDVFSLKRKAEKVTCVEKTRLAKKAIVSIEKTETVPSRCITVDNPDHLYVCDKGWTVTHNTEIFRAIEYHVLKSSTVPIGIIHLEEDNATTVKAIATYELRQPVIVPDSVVSREDIMKAYKAAVKNSEDRVYIHSSFSVDDEDDFINNIRFLVTVCGCELIFLDHISWLATGGNDEDERKKLDRISQRLKLLAKELRFCMIMISHVNDDGKTRGSRNISKVANTVINLSRNTVAADLNERNRMYLTVEKARLGGQTGPAGYLVFNRETATLDDPEDTVPI